MLALLHRRARLRYSAAGGVLLARAICKQQLRCLFDCFSSLCVRHILCRSAVLFSVMLSPSHCPGYLALHCARALHTDQS